MGRIQHLRQRYASNGSGPRWECAACSSGGWRCRAGPTGRSPSPPRTAAAHPKRMGRHRHRRHYQLQPRRKGRADMIARRPPVVLRSRAASRRARAFVQIRPGQSGAGRQTAGTEGAVVGDRQQSGCRRRRRGGGGSSILLLAGRIGRGGLAAVPHRRGRCVDGRDEGPHPPLQGGVHRPVLERRGERCRPPHGGHKMSSNKSK